MKSRVDELLPTLSGKKIEIPRYRAPGLSTAQMNVFLASAKAGKSIEYHFPDYVMVSRYRYDELIHPIQTIPLIIRENTPIDKVCPAHSDGRHYFVADKNCVCGVKYSDAKKWEDE